MGSVDIWNWPPIDHVYFFILKQILVYWSFYRIYSSPWRQCRARWHLKRWNIYNQYFNSCTVNACSLLSWSQYSKIIRVYKYVDLWFIWDFLHVIPTFSMLFQLLDMLFQFSPCYSNFQTCYSNFLHVIPTFRHVIPSFSMLFQLSDMVFQLSPCYSNFQTCYSNFLHAIPTFRYVIPTFRHVIPTFRHV